MAALLFSLTLFACGQVGGSPVVGGPGLQPGEGTCSLGVGPHAATSCPPAQVLTYDCGQGPQFTYLYTCPPGQELQTMQP